ncbi:MATE family efflux transporter [Micromonospora sp. SH-82]|uniref:MATE family efflux transporter n=1 Tax=Micromonospora sp. SH-82 TaxID=3132938 RepID=UPI003EB6BA3E
MALAEIVDFLVLLGTIAAMGRMGGEAIYVRSLYQPIAFLILAIGIGFGVSAQVSAAVSRGSDRPQDVLPTVWSMTRVWVLLGGLICLALAVCAPGIASLLDVDPGARDVFVSFVRWTPIAEMSAIAGGLCAACLRGYGHVGSAMVVSLAGGAVKLGSVVLLGLGAGIGVASVPVAAALAAVVSLVVGAALLRRKGLWRPGGSWAWRPEVLGRLWLIGVPVAGTFLIIALYNGAVLLVLGPYGPDAVSGYSVAAIVQALVVLPGTLLGAATAILINQQRGAGRIDGIGRTSRAGLELSFLLYAPVALAVWLAAEPIGHLMTNETGVAQETSRYLTVVGLTYVVQGPVLAALTLMEHTGGGFVAAALNLIYFAIIVLVGWTVADRVQSVDGFYAGLAVCNLVGLVVPIVAHRHVSRVRATAG